MALLATAWGPVLGNHLSALFYRVWVDAPQFFAEKLLSQFFSVLLLLVLLGLDTALMFYFRGRGKRFFEESHLIPVLYGPARSAFYRGLWRAMGWVLMALLLLFLSWPLMALWLIEPVGGLMTLLFAGLLLAALRPGSLDTGRRRLLGAAALLLVSAMATGDFSSEDALGRLLIAGVLGVGLWVFMKSPAAAAARGRWFALSLLLVWLLLAVFMREMFCLSLGLMGALAWVGLNRNRLRPLTGLGLFGRLLGLGALLFVWHAIRVNPRAVAPERWAVTPPGVGAIRLVSGPGGSVAGLDTLGQGVWVRPPGEAAVPFTIQLPRNFRVTHMALVRDDLLAVTGGSPVGADKKLRSVSYEALNEVLVYGVGNGLKLLTRERAVDCDLLSGAAGYSERRAFLVCARPHGVIPLSLRDGKPGELLSLSGLQRPGALAVAGGQGLMVTEGHLGAGFWFVPVERGNKLGDPLFYPVGPLGPVGRLPGSPFVWLATTPAGGFWRIDTSGEKPHLRLFQTPPGASFWRPAALAVTGLGLVVVESPLASGARGFRPVGRGGLWPQPLLSFVAANRLAAVAADRARVWLATPGRLFAAPVKPARPASKRR